MSTGDLDALLPRIERQSAIPRLLHQTYPTKELPPAVRENVDRLRDENPAWRHELYDDAGIEAFLSREYGPAILSFYLSIDPGYGAARADFFRYLVVYKHGGIYLDIKSRFLRPIDEVLRGDEGFVVSYWNNAPGEPYAGFGLHTELAGYPHGEIQQWHVISTAGHPFLRAMILSMLDGIRRYDPWRTGVGKSGVLRLTGPIAYTKAITPLLDAHEHRTLGNQEEMSLQYSFLPGEGHRVLFRTHYTAFDGSIVRLRGVSQLSARVYVRCRRIRRGTRAAINAVQRQFSRTPKQAA